MTTLPLSTVKATLSEVVEGVVRTHDRVTITRNGSVDDLEALEETLVLRNDPAAQARIAEGAAAVDRGDVLDEAQTRAEFAHLLR